MYSGVAPPGRWPSRDHALIAPLRLLVLVSRQPRPDLEPRRRRARQATRAAACRLLLARDGHSSQLCRGRGGCGGGGASGVLGAELGCR